MKTPIYKLGKVSITVDEELWDTTKSYDRLVIVPHSSGIAYISRCLVPRGIAIDDKKYWIPLGVMGMSINVKDYKLLDTEADLPINSDSYEGPYLIGSYAYFWVSTGGNVQDKSQYKKVQVAGLPGKSAYEIYREYIEELGGDDDPLTETEWSAQFNKLMNLDLVQTITINGSKTYPNNGDINIEVHDGLSAYQLAQQAGFAGNLPDWLLSLKGSDGQDGQNGAPGVNGQNGQDGHTPVIIIGTNGTWVIDGVDTEQPARGPKGENGQDGTLTLQEGETPTIEFVPNLTTDDDLPNNIKVLTAGAGKQLYTKTRLVIDIMDYNYTTDGSPTLENVPEDGLVCYCVDDYKLRYFYIQESQASSEQQEPTRDVQEVSPTRSVECIVFDPDPHLLYCDCSEGDAGRVIRYENGNWITVSSGSGGLTMQISGHKLIFTQLQGGGDFDITPSILATATNTNFGDIESAESKELQFLVKGSHLVDDVTISTTNNKVLFYIGTDTPSSSLTLTPDNKGKLNGNAGYIVKVKYTASTEVLTNTNIEFVVEVTSENAETKSITFTGREVPEKVPMLYLDENDETATNLNKTLYAPLTSVSSSYLDSNVVGPYGMSDAIRIYTKNIQGDITVEFDDEANADDIASAFSSTYTPDTSNPLSLYNGFSLDNDINTEQQRTTSLTISVEEDGYIDIPIRLPKQTSVGNVYNKLKVTYNSIAAYVNLRGNSADYDVSGTIYAKQRLAYCGFSRTVNATENSTKCLYANTNSYTSKSTFVGLYSPYAIDTRPNEIGSVKLQCPSSITSRHGYVYDVESIFCPSSSAQTATNYRFVNDSNILSVDLYTIGLTNSGGAFRNCNNLKYARFHNRTYISGYMFTGCSSLKVCMFDKGIHYMSSSFGDCNNLEHIIVKQGVVFTDTAYPFPTITITAEHVTAYNQLELDTNKQLTNDEIGLTYFGSIVNGVPKFITLHKTGSVTFAKSNSTNAYLIWKSDYTGDTTTPRFKFVENDAAQIENYDVDNDELIYTSNNN